MTRTVNRTAATLAFARVEVTRAATTAPAPAVHTLQPDTSGAEYTFAPTNRDTVVVTCLGDHFTRVEVPTQEARELWRRLVRRGWRKV
jgi:hypothetical protein